MVAAPPEPSRRSGVARTPAARFQDGTRLGTCRSASTTSMGGRLTPEPSLAQRWVALSMLSPRTTLGTLPSVMEFLADARFSEMRSRIETGVEIRMEVARTGSRSATVGGSGESGPALKTWETLPERWKVLSLPPTLWCCCAASPRGLKLRLPRGLNERLRAMVVWRKREFTGPEGGSLPCVGRVVRVGQRVWATARGPDAAGMGSGVDVCSAGRMRGGG